MKKLVFDADALIKIVKAGILIKIPHHCMISYKVHEEVVEEGKKRFYADAFQIEQLVKEGRLKVYHVSSTQEIYGLGEGELSTLAVFSKEKADVIISDDRAFLRALEEMNIPFIVPTELIIALVVSKVLEKQDAIKALNRIKEFVRKENYESALEALGGVK